MIKNVWLDANILIDFLTQRDNFGENATKIFELGEKKKIIIYISLLSFVNTFYVLKSKHYKVGNSEIKYAFEQLLNFVKIAQNNKNDIFYALESDFQDFEDAIQYFSTQNQEENIDFLVTRNKQDFSSKNQSSIICTPEEFLNIII